MPCCCGRYSDESLPFISNEILHERLGRDDAFCGPLKDHQIRDMGKLLCAYATLLRDVCRKAREGRRLSNGHNCDSTAACQSIFDMITRRAMNNYGQIDDGQTPA